MRWAWQHPARRISLGKPSGSSANNRGIAAIEEKRARERAAVTTTGIGVAFERRVDEPGEDGYRWLLWASDGKEAATLEAAVSRTQAIALDSEIPVLALQRVIERIAGNFPAEKRLAALVATSPLQLRSGHFKDRDFEFATGPLSP